MATLIAPCFKDKASEANKGNLSVDVMQYTVTGNEAVGDVVLLRRMGEYNKFIRARLLNDAMAAAMTVDIGYISRAEDGTDDDDFFGAALDVNGTTDHDLLTAPVEISEPCDIALTLNTDFSADADSVFTLVLEFICEAG